MFFVVVRFEMTHCKIRKPAKTIYVYLVSNIKFKMKFLCNSLFWCFVPLRQSRVFPRADLAITSGLAQPRVSFEAKLSLNAEKQLEATTPVSGILGRRNALQLRFQCCSATET